MYGDRDGCPRFAKPAPACRGAYLGRKRRGDPDFLYAALDRTACAAFIKESRMKFVGSPKPNRKFGFWGTRRFVAVRKTSLLA